MKQEGHFPVYEAALQAIIRDPEAVIRQRRVDQVMSLKLTMPSEILARRRMRRIEWEKFETCKDDIEKLTKTIELAVKTERDASNKLKYPNKETRAVEIQSRLENDPQYSRLERMRRTMYSQVKQHDEEIDFLERMDLSLVEICALFTAMLEYEAQGKEIKDVGNRNNQRTQRRAAARAKAGAAVAGGGGEESIRLAG